LSKMTFRKKMTVSVIAASMLTSSLAGALPPNQQGMAEKLGWIHVANAAGTEIPSDVLGEQPAEQPVEQPEVEPGEGSEQPGGQLEEEPGEGSEQPDGQLEEELGEGSEEPGELPAVDSLDQLTERPIGDYLARMNELYAALAAGDPADFQDVVNFQKEIAGLDETVYLQLIDPIWNKFSDKLPPIVDQAAVKTSLFRLIKAVGSVRYDPEASDLRAIRRNPEFIALIRIIEAASGENIRMDDLLVFLFGDGASRKGVEGTLAELLTNMSPLELAQLLGDKQKMITVLLQATEQMLSETDNYKLSAILKQFGVTSQDVRTTVLGFQRSLKKAEPAIGAVTIAYIRMTATSDVNISDNGRVHEYGLRVFGIQVPSLVLQWTKISGSPDITVAPNGVVTLAEPIPSASAIIQAKLINPYGGSAKIIYEQEVTLTAVEEEGASFPVQQYLERMKKLRDALAAGDPADIRDIRKFRDELANLHAVNSQSLINPIWNRIGSKLPASVDQAKLKTSLFEIIREVISFQYDPEATELEAILANPEFKATLKSIAAAAGVTNVSMDDLLIWLLGDGGENKGVAGTFRDIALGKEKKELAQIFSNKKKINAILDEAIATVLSNSDDYAISLVLSNLGVKSKDIASVVDLFQAKLKSDEAATYAMAIAYIRSEVIPQVEITDAGRQHQYGLTIQAVEIPASVLKWKKVSGSKDVKVDSNGKVTLQKKALSGKAVIQATLVNPYSGRAKVVFEQEVELGENQTDQVQRIIKALEVKFIEITKKLEGTKNDLQKARLILEVAQAGKDSINQINKVDVPQEIKDQAISDVKIQVSEMFNVILLDLMGF
jgi:hypothetical protein